MSPSALTATPCGSTSATPSRHCPPVPSSLTQALIGLLEDEPRRRSMGAAGRELAEREYAWDGIARRLTGIYDLVTGEARVGVRT